MSNNTFANSLEWPAFGRKLIDNMKRIAHFVGLALLAAGAASCTTVDRVESTPTDSNLPSFVATAEADREARETGAAITPYPFDTCAVQFHKPFKDGKPKHRRVYKGQEVLFCCTPCVNAFDMKPEPYMPRILAAVQAQAPTPTPTPSTAP